jgi:exopolyphosphatase/guanosine-5'-triphosphate,3'-diphosphate pyrophosphatase
MKEKKAVIDLGSNSVRMNIIGINEAGGYSIFDQAKEMVRLSEGLLESHYLQDKSMDRTIKALKYFKKLIKMHEITEVHALCTAAVRMAKNQEMFLRRVKEEVGLNFRVLSGEEEAYYDYLGVVNSMVCDKAVLIDIGGGSTEIIWVEDRRFKDAVSLPYGSVLLTEMFSDISSKKKRIKEALRFMKEALSKISWLKNLKGYPIIGLGGTIRALGKVDKYMNDYPIRNMHNYHLTTGEIEFLIDKIFITPDGKEHEIEGISKKRSDVMTMGLMPLYALIHQLEAREMRISGSGLRNGYFYEKYFKKIGQPIIVKDVLEHSYVNMMRRFSVPEKHSSHVQKLALALFDQLSSIHDFQERDREALAIASLLHDVGIHIEYYDHHLHGMYMLLYARINGLRIKEHVKVAFLVGNHRANGLKHIIDDYRTMFTKKELRSIQELSIFLQIAEQLDRSVTGVVEKIEVEIIDDYAMIYLHAKEIPELEMEAARRFSESFKKAYGLSYHLQYKPIV